MKHLRVIFAAFAVVFVISCCAHSLSVDEIRSEVLNVFHRIGTVPDEKTVNSMTSMCNAVHGTTHGKISVEDIVMSLPVMSMLSAGMDEDLNMMLSKPLLYEKGKLSQPPIKTAYFLMDFLPRTKGKLSADEKLSYAFLVSCGMNDAPAKAFDLDTPERLRETLSADIANNPEKYSFFDLVKKRDSSSANFGVTVENPVRAASIPFSYYYLDSLKTKQGGDVSYKRLGHMLDESDNIIDVYTLTFTDDGEEKSITIFVDPYCAENSLKAPAGLILTE